MAMFQTYPVLRPLGGLAALAISRRAQLILLGTIQAAAVALTVATEYGVYHTTLALLALAFLNAVLLLALRRPLVSAATALGIAVLLVEMSRFKFGIMWMTVTFLDLLIIDRDTINFLATIFPQLRMLVLAALFVAVPAIVLLWRLDRLRVPRATAAALAVVCLAGIVPMALAFPEKGFEPFQGVNHLSNFARSGVSAVSQLTADGWIDAAPTVRDPVPMVADKVCRPGGKLPNIVVVLDESSFDASAVPDIRLPPGYADYFRSFDGKARSLVVESTGGPTWYAEYNLLTGLSARSYGKLKFYVTRIAAERVERGLPLALKRCGYKTFSLYPTPGEFLGARRFQTSVGIDNFIDLNAMGLTDEMNPDRVYFDQALKVIARERGDAPLFVLVYLTANHFPWTSAYRPDLLPDWKAPGNTPDVDEYLRRQMMTARDYGAFVDRLKQDFPGDPFLLVRFGDHQPAISTRMLDPDAKPEEIARRVMAHDPRYFTTYYAIDAVSFRPKAMPSAVSPLEASYLPIAIQEAAGVPLDPSFLEQKRILQRCGGTFYGCAGGHEARRLNRLLMDAGMIRGL
jgi:hypothetical protein